MAVSSTHRWIASGILTLRRFRDTRSLFSPFDVEVLIEALESSVNQGTDTVIKGERITYIEDMEKDKNKLVLLISQGDKNVSEPAFLDFTNRKSRRISKTKNEGNHVGSHIIINRNPDANGGHLILLEYNSGITLNWISSYFGELLKPDRYHQEVIDETEKKLVRVVPDIVGHANRSIAEAMIGGTVKDISFVGVQKTGATLDKDALIQEVVDEKLWKIGKSIDRRIIEPFFRKIHNEYINRKKTLESNEVYIRIKTERGQSKQTVIDFEQEDYLQQAFFENYKITGFKQPLPQEYLDFHPQVKSMITQIFEKYV